MIISRVCIHSLLSLNHLHLSSFMFKEDIARILADQLLIFDLSLILRPCIVPVCVCSHMHGHTCMCKLTGTCVHACTHIWS